MEPTNKMYIEAHRKFDEAEIKYELLDDLPGKTVSLTATIQYIELLPRVKKYLEGRGKEVVIKKGAYYEGHVLGCNSAAFDTELDTMLMITDGTFHALNNALQLQKPIYVFTTTTLELLSQEEIDRHNTKTKIKQGKFLAAERVGLLLSTKYGQKNKRIHNLRNAIEATGKKAYIFEANSIDIGSFENYPQIDLWINTACYGLGRDDPRIINVADVLKMLWIKS